MTLDLSDGTSARYALAVLDAPERKPKEGSRSCAVFLTPQVTRIQSHPIPLRSIPYLHITSHHIMCVCDVGQGQEHSWQYASAEGQAQLLGQAGYARMIFVALNSGLSRR